jgi:hypothetical protein
LFLSEIVRIAEAINKKRLNSRFKKCTVRFNATNLLHLTRNLSLTFSSNHASTKVTIVSRVPRVVTDGYWHFMQTISKHDAPIGILNFPTTYKQERTNIRT